MASGDRRTCHGTEIPTGPVALPRRTVRRQRIADDVRRRWYGWRASGATSTTHPPFASVTVDRLTGWFVLPFLSLATLGLFAETRTDTTPVAVAIDLGTLTALSLLALVTTRVGVGRLRRDGWQRFLDAVQFGARRLLRDRRHLGAVLAAGVAFQALQCLAVWSIARAIDAPVGLAVVFAYFPPTAIAQNLPIGLGGLGVREAMFVLFLGSAGTPRGTAITLGLLLYAVVILTSATGAPSFATGGRGGGASPPPTRGGPNERIDGDLH
ncbi:MAG: lysylphosphatidylglycerol synthase transmembrane domain-containing protein [Microthrixaceae bacterium]